MENLITVDDVRLVCLPKRTFDTAKFLPFIEICEINYLKPFMGDNLYAEIRAQYLLDNISTLNQYLIDKFFKKALAWFVLHKALPFIQMDITNSGIQINNSEFASSGTDKQRSDLVNSALDMGNAYLSSAKFYIESDSVMPTYPLYTRSGNIANNTEIVGGIIFGDDYCYKCKSSNCYCNSPYYYE